MSTYIYLFIILGMIGIGLFVRYLFKNKYVFYGIHLGVMILLTLYCYVDRIELNSFLVIHWSFFAFLSNLPILLSVFIGIVLDVMAYARFRKFY